MADSAIAKKKEFRGNRSESLIKALGSVDWDFASRTAGSELEGIHPYPAKFIPEIPASFLDTLEIPSGSLVFDPFAGSGTTLVECQRRGIRSLGIDLNPIACLIARVKTSAVPDDAEKVLATVVSGARKGSLKIPNIPNLDHWFTGEIQRAVTGLCGAINRAPAAYQDILRLGLSSILVRVSNQESDTRYAAVEKNIDPLSVVTFFQTAVLRILRSLAARRYPLTSAAVIEGDTLATDPAAIDGRLGR